VAYSRVNSYGDPSSTENWQPAPIVKPTRSSNRLTEKAVLKEKRDEAAAEAAHLQALESMPLPVEKRREFVQNDLRPIEVDDYDQR